MMSEIDRRRFLLAGAALSAKAGLAASVLSPLALADLASADPDLLMSPVSYGYRDHVVSGTRRARVYFPSRDTTSPTQARIRAALYPLVVFCHGERNAGDMLCPPDFTRDYQRWNRLLRLLARCGFIVVAPAMNGLFQNDDGGPVLEEVVRWARTVSPYRSYLRGRDPREVVAGNSRLPDADLAFIGHSWGTIAIDALLRGGRIRPYCLAFLNGTWPYEATRDFAAIRNPGLPLLLVCGGADETPEARVGDTVALFGAPRPFAFQAVIQSADHWSASEVEECGGSSSNGPSAVAGDVLVTFLYKYLYRRYHLASSLQTAIGGRPAVAPWQGDGFALAVRWNDPLAPAGVAVRGTRRFGLWMDMPPW